MPVRKSKRTKAQAKAKAIHPWDVDFGHLWRQLVRVGWTSKKPTRLSNTWSRDSRSRYAIAEGIISANADSYDVTIPEQSDEPEAPVEPEKPALPALPEEPESVTASQIDTTVALSVNTIEGVFGPDSKDDGEYTQQNGDSNTENEERVSQIDTSVALSASTIDLANAHISHKEACRIDGAAPLKRVEWFELLHKQLLQLTDEDLKAVTPSPSPMARKRRRKTSHTHKQLDEWVIVSGVQKRRQRACKVCSLYRGEQKKSFQTTYYCEDCSQGDAKCFLCPKARRGTDTTCFQVWHEDFECGASIPSHLGKRVVLRRAPKAAGVRKKTSREIECEEKEES
ncbi:unnamed protein product [Phytophthora lilii]|uniref:Unnamed protein product n=1 Tax=Phytophthora lilii TaxID=2077276 RepID=A0A9W7CQF8_9STRA|nr:unnamed protein product [Phytophthora lilii]